MGLAAPKDEPFQLIYKEAMEAFPESKFVYTDRDPAAWLFRRQTRDSGVLVSILRRALAACDVSLALT